MATEIKTNATSTDKAPASTGSWFDEMRVYLMDKGWTIDGLDERNIPRFKDPQGTDESVMKLVDSGRKDKVGEPIMIWKPRQTLSVFLPTKDGNMEEFKQTQGLPIPWTYRIEEAYGLQKERDGRAEKKAKEEADRKEQTEVDAKRYPVPTKPGQRRVG